MADQTRPVCAIDAVSVGTESADPEAYIQRIVKAILRLQADGFNVILVSQQDISDSVWSMSGMEPAFERDRFMYTPAFNDTVVDTVRTAAEYECFFLTSGDVRSLESDWRLPSTTQAWLRKHRSLHVSFRFEEGSFHPEFQEATRGSSFSGPKTEMHADLFDEADGKMPTKPHNKLSSDDGKAADGPQEVRIAKLVTGWITDSRSPEMAVLPFKYNGIVQPVLAIVGENEKDVALQQAGSLANNLGRVHEEEDLGEWKGGQVRGPWSDRGLSSHVAFVSSGNDDGLWALGAGYKKLARRRAAKLALAVAERANKSARFPWTMGPQLDLQLQSLLDRAQRLMQQARLASPHVAVFQEEEKTPIVEDSDYIEIPEEKSQENFLSAESWLGELSAPVVSDGLS